jgi:hypothetical protein
VYAPPVIEIGPAPDQLARLQPLEQSGHAAPIHVQELGQLRRADTPELAHDAQHEALLGSQAERCFHADRGPM